MNLYKSRLITKFDINKIYKLFIEYLYDIDINYLKAFLQKNNYDINNDEKFYSDIINNLSYYIFSLIIKKQANSKQINIDEIYKQFIDNTDILNVVYEYNYPKIKSIINHQQILTNSIIDFNNISFSRKEKIIHNIVKEIIAIDVENNSLKIKNYIINNMDINIIKSIIRSNIFLHKFITQSVKILQRTHKSDKLINNWIDSVASYFYNRLRFKLNVNIKDDIKLIITKNIDQYLILFCRQIFTDEKETKRLLKKQIEKSEDINNQVIQAYNNVKTWLKEDYPHLELNDLDSEIVIYADNECPEAKGYCRLNWDGSVTIHLSKSSIQNGQTYLTELIYHELIHTIKGQGDMARRISKFKKDIHDELSSDKFQELIHNDDIWDQGIDTIRKHTHLDARGFNTNKDITNADFQINQLQYPHEATLICYNCGWFKVYVKWNEDCNLAYEDQFTCPKCHQKDVKLISPCPGEKELLDDALSHIHYQVAEQMPYESINVNRLRTREGYQRLIRKIS